MQLPKTTELRLPRDKRWYDDACGTALALELLGERWSLLIVRELMFGGRRFGELRASLPGVSAKVLTERLQGLEAAGVLTRRTLPPPASAQIYELTEWGYAAEPSIQELGRWAAASPLHDPTLPLSAASLMMSFRTMFTPARAEGLAAEAEIAIGREQFAVSIANGALSVRRGTAPGAALRLAADDAMTLAAAVYGGVPLGELTRAGALRVEGDAALAEAFVRLFVLPDKIG